MAHNGEHTEKPLVSLEAGKLLGLRQVAKVSARRADSSSRDPGGSASGAADSRAETSRFLSKIGDEETDSRNRNFGVADSRAETSRLLSKIDETPPKGTGAADSRAKISRLLSKIGEEELAPLRIGAANSRVKMSRLLSKIGIGEEE